MSQASHLCCYCADAQYYKQEAAFWKTWYEQVDAELQILVERLYRKRQVAIAMVQYKLQKGLIYELIHRRIYRRGASALKLKFPHQLSLLQNTPML